MAPSSSHTVPPATGAPLPQSSANVPASHDTKRPPGVLKKQPPGSERPIAFIGHDDPRVRFETPVPTDEAQAAIPASTSANIPHAPAGIQPLTQIVPTDTAPVPSRPTSVVQPNVQPGTTGVADRPADAVTRPSQTSRPSRERPVVTPVPVMPTPGPTVSPNVPRPTTMSNVPNADVVHPTTTTVPGSNLPIGSVPTSQAPLQPSSTQNVPSGLDNQLGDGSGHRPQVKQKPVSPAVIPHHLPSDPVHVVSTGPSSGPVGVSDPAQIEANEPAHKPNVLRKPPPGPGKTPTVQHSIPDAGSNSGVDVVGGKHATTSAAQGPNVLKKPPPPAKSGPPIESVANIPSAADSVSGTHSAPVPSAAAPHSDETLSAPPIRKGLPTVQGAPGHSSVPGQSGATISPDAPAVATKPTIVPGQAPGGVARPVSPEAALAEKERIAGKSCLTSLI